jgi:hypothetical protein
MQGMSGYVAGFAVRNVRYVWWSLDATKEGHAFVIQYAFPQGGGEIRTQQVNACNWLENIK